MWRGCPRPRAEARALEAVRQREPSARAVVRTSEINGIDWVVHLWVFGGPQDESPHEAWVRVRGPEGHPVDIGIRG